eukprot:308697-Ditylum_brightwellii.AAC.1
MCKEDCLGVKVYTIEEDGEGGASLCLSKKPISSQVNTCTEDCLGVKEYAIKEDGEVWASLFLSKKPVSSQEI